MTLGRNPAHVLAQVTRPIPVRFQTLQTPGTPARATSPETLQEEGEPDQFGWGGNHRSNAEPYLDPLQKPSGRRTIRAFWLLTTAPRTGRRLGAGHLVIVPAEAFKGRLKQLPRG